MRMTGKVKNKNKKKSQAAAVWRRLKKNKMAVLGLIILAVIIFFAVFADVFFDYETLVIQQNASLKLQPPSVEHWLGTDEVGRDILARIVHGARISLPVAFATIAIATVVGGLLGAIAGYGSRRVDDVIMRVMDIFLAIPSILLSIALVSAMGTSVTNMMLAISISNIPPFARIVRSAVLTIKNEEYIEAARAIGASDKRIILKHILPNCMAPHHCAGHAVYRRVHPGYRQPQLHRPGHQPAHAGVGFYGQHRPAVFPGGLVGVRVPGLCHHVDHPLPEPAGRRPAGCPGPQAEELRREDATWKRTSSTRPLCQRRSPFPPRRPRRPCWISAACGWSTTPTRTWSTPSTAWT